MLAGRALGSSSPVTLLAAAAAGGTLLLAAVWWIARARNGGPGRAAQLACAASGGLAALPALASVWLHLGPGAAVWLAALMVCLGAALFRASRGPGPGAGLGRQLRGAGLWLGGGSVVVFGVAMIEAAIGGSGPLETAGRADSIYEVDARVATRALPVCDDAAPVVRVLHDRGAHPRLEPKGAGLWFDAGSAPSETRVADGSSVEAGVRQVYRLDLHGGGVTCWTCDEPGSNLRPYPGERALVFETDRHADWRDPANTELHLVRRVGGAPREPSRRLTREPGPDDHALVAPVSGRVVWSRRDAGGYEVVWAPIQSAHGALLLGGVAELARGGAAWLAPAAWSPDARSLVLVSGNPFAPLVAQAVDLATGAIADLGEDVVPGGAAFSADGAIVVVAGTRRGSPTGLLPVALGALLAPVATRLEREGGLHRETSLRIGAATGELRRLSVPEVETWGAPTGVALSPDGTRVYLAQRSAGGARERLVEILRDCR